MKRLVSLLLILIPVTTNAEANWTDFKAVIGAQRFSSTSQIVAQFPAEMLDNWALQFSTESPQVASPMEPRLLMTSDSAKFLAAIAGGPRGESRSRIMEFAQFSDVTESYEPHLMILEDNGKATFVEDAKGYFPRDHPRNCVHCHGEDWRPLMDSYARWPHSYGSGYANADDIWARINKIELKNFNRFQNSNGQLGMYKYLTNLQKVMGFHSNGEQRTHDLHEKMLRMTFALSMNNERRIFKSLRNNPGVLKYAREIMAVLLWHYEKDLPFKPELEREYSSRRAALENEIDSAILINTHKKDLAFGNAMGERAIYKYNFDRDHVKIMARLKFLLDKAGVSMDEWPMTIEKGTYSFSDGQFFFTHLSKFFFEEIFLPNTPGLKKIMRLRKPAYGFSWPARPFEYQSVSYKTPMESEGILKNLAQGIAPEKPVRGRKKNPCELELSIHDP
jgi:hypothetical protein